MMHPLDESYRMLRVAVEAAVPTPGLVVVTSAVGGDGKTEVASGLARALAECGYKTALVDTNWQNPRVGATLGMGDLPALTSLEQVRTSGRNGAVKNLEAISLADHRFPALVSSERMKGLVADLLGGYQYVVIDSAPIPIGMAGLQFARFADGVIIAVRMGRAPRAADKMTLETLERVGARVLGIVATGASPDQRIKSAPLPAALPADEPAVAIEEHKEPVRVTVGA